MFCIKDRAVGCLFRRNRFPTLFPQQEIVFCQATYLRGRREINAILTSHILFLCALINMLMLFMKRGEERKNTRLLFICASSSSGRIFKETGRSKPAGALQTAASH